jgi:hypothetical protein
MTKFLRGNILWGNCLDVTAPGNCAGELISEGTALENCP